MRVGIRLLGSKTIVQEFDSVEECAEKLELSKTKVMEMLKQKKPFKGYKFVYLPNAKEEKV